MMATERKQPKDSGLECPVCGYPDSSVVWTRKRTLRIRKAGEEEFKTVGAIVRARECGNEFCGYRYQTSEAVQEE